MAKTDKIVTFDSEGRKAKAGFWGQSLVGWFVLCFPRVFEFGTCLAGAVMYRSACKLKLARNVSW